MHNIRSSFGIPGDVSSVKSFPYLSHPLYKDVKDVKFKDCSNKMIGIGNFSLMFWKEFVNPQSCVFVFFCLWSFWCKFWSSTNIWNFFQHSGYKETSLSIFFDERILFSILINFTYQLLLVLIKLYNNISFVFEVNIIFSVSCTDPILPQGWNKEWFKLVRYV